MKVLFLALLVVAGVSARSAVQQHVQAEGPACPIDDPLRSAGPVLINVTFDPIVKIDEPAALTDVVAVGLSGLWYNIDINAILLTASFEVRLPAVDGNATYTASGYIDARPFRQVTVPSGNFTGAGLGKVSASDIYLKGSASIFLTITGKVQLSRLVVAELRIGSLALDFEAWVIGGAAIDWDAFNRDFKANFDQDWGQHKEEIVQKIRGAANEVLKKYSLQELIDLIGGGGGGEC